MNNRDQRLLEEAYKAVLESNQDKVEHLKKEIARVVGDLDNPNIDDETYGKGWSPMRYVDECLKELERLDPAAHKEMHAFVYKKKEIKPPPRPGFSANDDYYGFRYSP